eukprot:g30263.t1
MILTFNSNQPSPQMQETVFTGTVSDMFIHTLSNCSEPENQSSQMILANDTLIQNPLQTIAQINWHGLVYADTD